MPGEDVGELVTLEHVLERSDLEVKIVRDAHEHEDFILAVRVTVYDAFAFEDFENSIELQIAARGDFQFAAFKIFERALVIQGSAEFIPDNLFDSFARLRIPRCVTVAPVALFHIFSEREFYGRHSS